MNDWLENMEDWCISRQLWWGHRIPMWQNSESGQWQMNPTVTSIQDPDVLDTWFSSCLLPLSKGSSYPQDLIETGSDILNIWVTRMILLCTYLSGSLPFKRIFLHPLVRDWEGRKMSKSLGNVIDPISVVDGRSLEQLEQDMRKGNIKFDELEKGLENLKKQFPHGISPYGNDSLRLALLSNSLKTKFLLFDLKKCDNYKAFLNKIVQASNFIFHNFDLHEGWTKSMDFIEPYNRQLVSKLSKLCKEVNANMEDYEFSKALQCIQRLKFQ